VEATTGREGRTSRHCKDALERPGVKAVWRPSLELDVLLLVFDAGTGRPHPAMKAADLRADIDVRQPASQLTFSRAGVRCQPP